MSEAYPLFGEDDHERFFETAEANQQAFEVEKSFTILSNVLKKAIARDEAQQHIDRDKTRFFRIRELTGDYEFPFALDHVVLVPKKGKQPIADKLEVRFALNPKESRDDESPEFIFITEHVEGEQPKTHVMTRRMYGEYSDDVVVETKEDRVIGVHGVRAVNHLSTEFFSIVLPQFELDHQTPETL